MKPCSLYSIFQSSYHRAYYKVLNIFLSLETHTFSTHGTWYHPLHLSHMLLLEEPNSHCALPSIKTSFCWDQKVYNSNFQSPLRKQILLRLLKHNIYLLETKKRWNDHVFHHTYGYTDYSRLNLQFKFHCWMWRPLCSRVPPSETDHAVYIQPSY